MALILWHFFFFKFNTNKNVIVFNDLKRLCPALLLLLQLSWRCCSFGHHISQILLTFDPFLNDLLAADHLSQSSNFNLWLQLCLRTSSFQSKICCLCNRRRVANYSTCKLLWLNLPQRLQYLMLLQRQVFLMCRGSWWLSLIS